MKNYIYETIDFKCDPFFLLELFADQTYCFLLDSSLADQQRGRYTFFGCDPFKTYQHKGQESFDQLREELKPYQFAPDEELPLPAGIVGFIGYDHGLFQEKIRQKAKDDLNLPDCLFGFYDCIVTIDYVLEKCHISSTGFPELESNRRKRRASERIHMFKEKIEGCLASQPLRNKPQGHSGGTELIDLNLQSNFTEKEYKQMIEQALDYIASGEIYQVNLAQRFVFDNRANKIPSLELYRQLREMSPSHFGVYFNGGTFQIISSSPERYLQLKGDILQTQPMKGTRPRGGTVQEDQQLREEILDSQKDMAELLMITDLERNDLGRVCDYGSVKVKQMRTIEEYSTVFQAISTVEGRVQADTDQFDILTACFPGGSVTGCPKIRAMEIIETLEPVRRSIYTGAFGYIGFQGQMDFNILIRTVLAHQDQLYFQVGGGIVADSTPAGEYEETLVKAKAIKDCLKAIIQENQNFQNV